MQDIGDFICRSRRSAKIAIAPPGTPGDRRIKSSSVSLALNVVISRCCFAEDGKEMYQNVHVQRDCFCSLNLLFCGVVVVVAVVVA